MEEMFLIAGIISVLFLIFKLVEEKLKKQKINGKEIIKNTVVVFAASLVGIYAKEQLKPKALKTDVFVGEPTF
tara:strand:- start:13962 stop:14180 length:219 start_codon:yes stop_codon:yes gene_type:complete